MSLKNKQILFSAIQPTNNIHLGNYIGAISQWVSGQKKYHCHFCIADLHSLSSLKTTNPQILSKNTLNTFAMCLACGINPIKSNLFIQSSVSEHSELLWLLSCITPTGSLKRMTQYKHKAQLLQSTNSGLMNYPILMAADILLYQADIIPAGIDQKQHIELAQKLASTFNSKFGPILSVPKIQIKKGNEKIMGLDNPSHKMSKSIGVSKLGHMISLLDDNSVIKKKIMSATTDSKSEISFKNSSLGIKNLLNINKALSYESKAQIEKKFNKKNYTYLKKTTIELITSILDPIKKKYKYLINNKDYLIKIAKKNAIISKSIAYKNIKQIKTKMGIIIL